VSERGKGSGDETTAARQLVLDLAPDPGYGAEDFLISASNEAAYTAIEAWPNWPDVVLVLSGPSGSGKSHLAAIWAERSKACILSAAMIEASAPEVFLRHAALAIEDADRSTMREASLFHLLNLARESGVPVLITARRPPAFWGLVTADLLSRLRLAPNIALAAPDDSLMRAVLVKLLVDRQLVVDTSVVDLLALHLDRSLDAARRLVAALDTEALARGRRITRAMASEMLAALGAEESEAN